MFDIALNIQLLVRLFKVYYPKFTIMRGVEHKVYLFCNDVSKIFIVHKMIFPTK